MAALQGLTVLVPESRELDLFAAMLEEEGAATLRCPLVRILPLEDTGEARAFVDRCLAGDFEDIIFLTGEGIRHLLDIAGPHQDAFVAALGRMRKTIRGPKPARALRAIGLTPDIAAPQPTSDSVRDMLIADGVKGRSIAVQLYPGNGAARLVQDLSDHGANVTTVTPYRYASDADAVLVRDAIAAMEAGRIGLVAFTATPQIERLFQVAKDAGLEAALRAGFARTPVAAVGPVVQENLSRYGLAAALAPEGNFHLKPLVRAIMAWRSSLLTRQK